MKHYCKNHPNVQATHYITNEKSAKGFHGPAKLVTKIWLCELCYNKSQTDLLTFIEQKKDKKSE